MMDKTVNSTLLALRAQIIREKRDGLAHVNALLIARGVDPARHIVRAKRKEDVAGRGIMRLMVLDALRDGPRCLASVTVSVAAKRQDISSEAARKRTALVLSKLKVGGIVGRDGRLWGLVMPPAASSLSKRG